MRRTGFFADAAQLTRTIYRAMRVTFVNLLRKPVTVHYPDVERPYPDRYRGLLALTYDPATGTLLQ